MIAYSAAPGSEAEEKLKLLAAWSAAAAAPDTATPDTGPVRISRAQQGKLGV
jgi:hypothetical protein